MIRKIILSLCCLALVLQGGCAKVHEDRTAMLKEFDDSYEHQFIKTNGIQLHVVLAGPEGGEMVIFLHGFPEFWYGWRNQIDFFADQGYRVVVPDQRGYNLSDKPRRIRDYDISNLSWDIVGLIDHFGKEDVILVGHDWGAAVGWWTAIQHEDRIKKLGILNVPHPTVMGENLKSNWAQIKRSWYIYFFQLPWMPEKFMSGDDFETALKSISGKYELTDADKEKYKKAWGRSGAMKSMIHWYRSAFRSLRKAEKKAIVTVPTLMLWGKLDTALGSEMAQPSIDLCEDGRLIFFEDATHWIQHEKPNEVNRHLLEFIRE